MRQLWLNILAYSIFIGFIFWQSFDLVAMILKGFFE